MVKKNTGKMKPWLKGGLTGIAVFLLLALIMKISSSPCNYDNFIVGGESNCSSIYNAIYYSIAFIGLSIFFGGTLNISSFGPVGIYKFWIISFLAFFLWGAIIGWIIQKIKSKKEVK
jgi:hypothetical protein